MSLEDDILIEQFLKNELSKIEKEKVLERIKNDANFKQKVLLEKQLIQTLNESDWSFIENIENSEIKEYEKLFRSGEVKEIEKSISIANKRYQEKNTSKRKRWFLYSSVATIALLISLFIFDFSKSNNQDLYYKYLETNEIPSIINRGSTDYKIISEAETYFNNKEYKKAEEIFSSTLNNTKNSSTYLFLAISQLELNKVEEAEKTLNLLINSDLLDAEKGHWYKALLYLKTNQIAKAKTLLKIIINNSYYKNVEAEKLLLYLENIKQ